MREADSHRHLALRPWTLCFCLFFSCLTPVLAENQDIKEDELSENVSPGTDSTYFIEYITHPILRVITWPMEKFVVPVVELAFYPVKPPIRYVLREKVMERAQSLVSFGKKNNQMIYPIIVISTGTGSLTGLTYRHTNFGSMVEKMVSQYKFYVNGNQRINTRLHTHNYGKTDFRAKYVLGYNQIKNRDIVQPGTSFKNFYSDTTLYADADIHHRLLEGIDGVVELKYRNRKYQNAQLAVQQIECDEYYFSEVNGDCLERRGINQKFSVYTAGLGFDRNTINNENIPTSGSKVELRWRYHFGELNHDYHDWNVRFTKYFFLGVERYEISRKEQKELGTPNFETIKKVLKYRNLRKQLLNRKVVAMHFRIAQTHEVPGNTAPVPALQWIGNQTPLRGYNDDPFKDYAMASFSTEYRFPVMRMVEGTLFNEYGVVGVGVHKLYLSDVKNSWGFGMRFSQSDMFFFRTQLGFHGSHFVPVFNLTMRATYW